MGRLRLQFSRDLDAAARLNKGRRFVPSSSPVLRARRPPVWISPGVTAHRGYGLLLRVGRPDARTTGRWTVTINAALITE